jgi:hypothetical protein
MKHGNAGALATLNKYFTEETIRSLRCERAKGDTSMPMVISRSLHKGLLIKKVLTHISALSVTLLVSTYDIQSKADELPGHGRRPSGPAVAVNKYNTNVFVRGSDDHIYWWKGPGSSGWQEVHNSGMTRSEPAAVYYNLNTIGGDSLELYVRGLDNRIYWNLPDSIGSPWHEVDGGGLTLSGPAVVMQGGKEKLFIRGLDNGIWENDFDGSYSGWFPLSDSVRTISRPAPVVNSKGGLILFARGEENQVYEFDFSHKDRGWVEVPGGALTLAGPTAVAGGGQLRLFVTGLDDAVWENDLANDLDSSKWSGWKRLDTPLTASAPAAWGYLYLTTEDGKIIANAY